MRQRNRPIAAPDLRALLGELRAPLEVASFLLGAQQLRPLPPGDGHPVMFLPGFGMGEEALAPMARAIERLGYAVYGWDQGRNLGLRQRTAERLLERMDDLHRRHACAVSLVGWSAGGLYARELAHLRPERVRRVFTLGSPLQPHASGQALVEMARQWFDAYLAGRGEVALAPQCDPLQVPCTAIHSKSDGVVAWRAAMQVDAPHTENLEVDGTHLGLGFNLAVLRIIAERLPMAPADAVPSPPRKRRRTPAE